jgi:hypothetical protein
MYHPQSHRNEYCSLATIDTETITPLFNGTIFHDRQGNSITTLINMFLVEYEGTILGYKITEHASEYTAVKTYHTHRLLFWGWG